MSENVVRMIAVREALQVVVQVLDEQIEDHGLSRSEITDLEFYTDKIEHIVCRGESHA